MRFVCEHCDQILKVGSEKAGRRGKCPKCSRPITVPSEIDAAAAVARHKSSQADAGQDDDPFAEFIVYDVDTELIYDTDGQPGDTAKPALIDYRKIAVPRSVLYIQGILLGLVALASFTLGVLLGLNAASEADPQPQVASPCMVTGTVAYTGRARRKTPDEGAVVIMLPKDAKPEKRAEPFGLRPQDEFPDEDHPALWTIREIGGDYARTDENGQYRLSVKNTRSYYVLFISTQRNRQDDQDFDRSFLAKIGGYIYPATDLIGRNKYQWEEVASLRGTQKQLGEVIFE